MIQRAIYYGEGLFTSFRSLNGKLIFLEEHLKRLQEAFAFATSTFFFSSSWEQLKIEIIEGLRSLLALKKSEDYYFRIMLIPSQNDLEDKCWNVLIESSPLTQLNLASSSKDQVKKLYQSSQIRSENFYLHPSLKSPKLQDYLLELKREGLDKNKNDELFYLSEKKHLTETMTSNIFIYFDDEKKFFTPQLDSRILQGVIRSKFIKYLKENKIDLVEKDLSLENLINSDLIILTNSVKILSLANEVNYKADKIQIKKNIQVNKCKSFYSKLRKEFIEGILGQGLTEIFEENYNLK